MAFLLDANVLSELRKKRRNEPKVQGWLGSVDSEVGRDGITLFEKKPPYDG
jgi:predicted nucleic acid-binding protein